MSHHTRDDAIRRIQKLMRTADSNATEGEIRNACRMAADLMAKWDLEDADLATQDKSHSVKVVEIPGPGRKGSIEIIDRNLLNPVAVLCDVQILFRKREGREAPYFIGLERDATVAAQLWNDLRMQMRVLARHRVEGTDSRGKKWISNHVDYCKGFASTLNRRAYEIKRAAVHAAGPGCTAIVIRKTEAVDSYMDEKYGELKARRSRGQGYRNVAAFLTGQCDGEHVDLGEQRAAGDRALGDTKQLEGGA